MKFFINFLLFFLIVSCANILPPTGGDKDISPPKIKDIIMEEFLKNESSKVVKFEFDENIQFNKWEENFYISPPIKSIVRQQIKGRELMITIEDSLLEDITYTLTLSDCIKDLNEGNILNDLSFSFSTGDAFDTLTLSGTLKDAYTLGSVSNAWIMLFKENIDDTVIFKSSPCYISKTNRNGDFYFPNLKAKNYKVTALTGKDFIYDLEEEIAFFDRKINISKDSFISLFSFDPQVKIDTNNIDSISFDSLVSKSAIEDSILTGSLEIILNKEPPSIFQLLQKEKIIKEFYFSQKPYILNEIIAGSYLLKYIQDNNQDSIWTSGSWDLKNQPEKVFNYPSEILLRSNWDLEVEWIIEE